MKKFLFTLLIFLIVFFVADKMLYIILYQSPKLEKDKRLEEVINGNLNKNIIIIGSSRGARNIIASQIEDSLHVSAYNLSYPGSDIEFHEFLLRSLIKFNENPKTVLLVVDDSSELLPSENINFRLDRLYPLAKYDYINDEMINRNEKNFLSKFIFLSRINKRNFDLRKKRFHALDTMKQNGSMPISFQNENHDFIYRQDVNYNKKDELSIKIEAFQKFQKLCLLNNIELFMIFPPNFSKHRSSFEDRIKELSHPSVFFHVYDTMNTAYSEKSLYYDNAHLNEKGAKILTNEIIKILKKKLKK